MGYLASSRRTVSVVCLVHIMGTMMSFCDEGYNVRCHPPGPPVDCVCGVSKHDAPLSTVTGSRDASIRQNTTYNDTELSFDTTIGKTDASVYPQNNDNRTQLLNEESIGGNIDCEYVESRLYSPINELFVDWLCDLKNLTHLSLAVIGDDDFNWQRLQCLSRLQSINIKGPVMPATNSNILNMPLCNVLEHLNWLSEIRISGCNLSAVDLESVKGMKNLTDLVLSNNQISNNITLSLPYLEIFDVSNNKLTSLQQNSMYDLWNIKLLNYSYNDISYIDPEAFDPPKFQRSKSNTSDSVQMVWFNLVTIDLSHNKLTKLSQAIFISPIREVRNLLLRHNNISQLPRYSVEDLRSLERLDLSYNSIYWLDVGTFTNKNLKYIDLSHNKLKKIISMTFLYLPSLASIDLRHNQLNFIYKYAFYRICKRPGRVEVKLSSNLLQTDAIWTLLSSFHHVLKSGRCRVDIDLVSNRVTHLLGDAVDTLERYLEEGEFSYFSIWDLVRFNLSNNPLTCDCQVADEIKLLRTVLRRFPTSFSNPDNVRFYSGLLCTAPGSFVGTEISESVRTMICPLTSECSPSCHCVTDPDKRVIHVNCSYRSLRAIPTVLPPGIKELHLAGNQISHIPRHVDLGNVTLIDLSHNRITTIRPSVWGKLAHIPVVFLHRNRLKALPVDLTFGPEVKQVTLHGNPFRCMCLDQSLRTKLRNYSHIISDVGHVTCNTGEVVVDLQDMFFQCTLAFPPVSPTSHFNVPSFTFAALLAFGFTLMIIMFFLRHRILSFLRHKPGKYQVHAQSPYGKRYDLFLLFSDLDFDYVSDEFLPQIQERAPCYRICVPKRDWRTETSVGENMAYSADISRCTVFILSRYFLDNNLTCTDFYQALLGILQNPNNKTYCVSLEAVNFETRYPELHAAMQRHRMFEADDLLFWATLFNVLPPSRRRDTLLYQEDADIGQEQEPIINSEKY